MQRFANGVGQPVRSLKRCKKAHWFVGKPFTATISHNLGDDPSTNEYVAYGNFYLLGRINKIQGHTLARDAYCFLDELSDKVEAVGGEEEDFHDGTLNQFPKTPIKVNLSSGNLTTENK